LCYFSNFTNKLAKENTRPVGENSPNLVTLASTPFFKERASEVGNRVKGLTGFLVFAIEILELEQVCWHKSCKYFWGKNTL
jgi:hypothetical protein